MACVQSQHSTPEKVLFVGNSYTYFWNLPQQVSAMATERGIKMETRQSTAGGSNWGHHWRNERTLDTKGILEEWDCDAVVLQNHSLRTIEGPDSVMKYGKLFADLINHKDRQIYIYQTWSRATKPDMLDTISKVYNDLAEKIHATVVPVGKVWAKALQEKPDLALYYSDGSHPTNLGTYLTACTFYAVFTNRSTIGLPARLISQDIYGEKLYLNLLTDTDATFCQKIVDQVVFNK